MYVFAPEGDPEFWRNKDIRDKSGRTLIYSTVDKPGATTDVQSALTHARVMFILHHQQQEHDDPGLG